MCSYLAPEWFDRIIHIRRLSVIRHKSAAGECYSILGSKMGAPQVDPLEQNDNFLETPSNDFDLILAIYGAHLPK
jgi:hypothetical protein